MVKTVLRWKNIWLLLGCGLIALVIYLSLTPNPPRGLTIPGWDKIDHILKYGILTFWFVSIYQEKKTGFLFLAGFILMGVGLEYLQDLIPNRHFDILDILVNVIGSFAGLWLAMNYKHFFCFLEGLFLKN